MAQIYQYRQSEEEKHQIQTGLQEYHELTEEETRQAFAPRHRKEWGEQWGGRCPYEAVSKPDPGYKDRVKPSLIDRLMPYILIVGFMGYCYGCVWLGYLLMGVAK